MFSHPRTYCAESKRIVSMKNNGSCPGCGEICRPYPEFMRILGRFTRELERLTKLYPIAFNWLATRGETEWGVELSTLLDEANERIEQQYADIFLPHELPKLDIIAVAISHSASKERVLIHDDHYDDRFYWNSASCRPVCLSHATWRGLNETVFEHDRKTPHTALQFFELQLSLHLLQSQNALWYAALACNHYIMPSRNP